MSAASGHDCEYRIEADRCMSDYDALESDAGIMVSALRAIAEARANKQFDPWVTWDEFGLILRERKERRGR